MDRWKAEQGRVREKRKIRREKSRRERVRRKKVQMREKVGKSRNTVFFQWFVAPESRKVGSLKRRVRGQLARWEMKNCTPLWREAHFQVKMYKTPHVRATFGGSDVEKVQVVVARSTFPSQNVQNTPWSDHFWKLRCRKSARLCGAKHISKWKCTSFGPLLEVEMSKKCTPLWREAHFEVKMYQLRTTFGSWNVEKVHAVVARSTFRSQNVQNTGTTFGSWDVEKVHAVVASKCTKHTLVAPLLEVPMWKSARRCGAKHISKWKCTKHHMFAALLEVQMSLRFASLQYTTFHYTPLHYTTLHYTTLHNTTSITTQLHSTTLHYTKLHYTTLPSTTLRYITLHYTTLRYTTTTTTELHSTTLHYTTLHYTTLHYTTLHYTTLPSTTLHYITLHHTPLHYNYTYDYTTTFHYTPLHEITLHYIRLHYTTLHSITLHYTTLHYTTLHWHCTTDRQVDR